jgi:hypothetical protein
VVEVDNVVEAEVVDLEVMIDIELRSIEISCTCFHSIWGILWWNIGTMVRIIMCCW